MKSSQRQIAATVRVVALLLTGAPALAAAQVQQVQRGGPQGPDTKLVLVATFRSDDKQLAVQSAEAVRRRLFDEYPMKQLLVVPKKTIDVTLESSGYKPDSALSTSDLMELGKSVRADYVIDGAATKVAEGVRIDATLLLKRNQTLLSQPFPPVTAKNSGDAAKEVHKLFDLALKAMPSYVKCEGDLRAQKYDAAILDGRTVLAAYPASTLGRLCLLTAFTQAKSPPDSVLRVANEILAVDSTNTIALTNAVDAYNAKGDKDKVIEYNLKIYRADPSNTGLLPSIIQQLANSGAPDKALPIVTDLLKEDPNNVQMLTTQWKLLLLVKRYKDAITTGEAMVKADTSLANLDFTGRMSAAAALDSNPTLAMQYIARGVQKFPKEAELQLQYANMLYKAGQLQQALAAAQNVIVLNPKLTNAYTIALVAQLQTNQYDSAMVMAPRAIAAGVDKQTVADLLISVAGPAVKKAQETKARDDWNAALKVAQAVDAIAPSATTKYYIGVSAFSVAVDIANGIQEIVKEIQKPKGNTPANRAKACEQVKVMEEPLNTAAIAMPAGAKTDPASAGQIMGYIQTYNGFIADVKRQLNCK